MLQINPIFFFLVGRQEGDLEMFQDLKTKQKTDITAMLYVSLVDDKIVQDDSEKEFLAYEGINFLTTSNTLKEIILVQLIKV